MKQIILIILSLLTLITSSCRHIMPTAREFHVQAPFREADVPYMEHEFSNDTNVVIYSPTGTRISIPKDALEWEDGTKSTGPLTVKYREFHDAWGILRAGIPMEVAGNGGTLKSAGMIDIRIGKDGRQARLKKNARIGIALASFQDAAGFDLYFLEDDSRWQVRDTFQTVTNNRKSEELERLEQQRPDPSRFRLRRSTFVLNVDTAKLPYMAPLTGIVWKINPKEADKEFYKAMRVNWDSVKATRMPGGDRKFRLDFKSILSIAGRPDDTISYSIVATALPNRRNRGDGTLDRQLAQYENAVEIWNNDQKRVARQADLLNSFEIDKIGIWNIDVLMKTNDFVIAKAGFDFEQLADARYKKIKVFALYLTQNTVLPYDRTLTTKIAMPKVGDACLIAVIDEKNFAYVSNESLRSALASGSDSIFLRTERRTADQLPKMSGKSEKVNP